MTAPKKSPQTTEAPKATEFDPPIAQKEALVGDAERLQLNAEAWAAAAARCNHRRSHVERIRARLLDAEAICIALGLGVGARRQPGGIFIRCPWHDDHQPSCSVRLSSNGHVYAKCFACQASGDVFSLIARVRGLDVRRQFAAVVAEAERLADVLPDVMPSDGRTTAPTEPGLADTDFHRLASAMLDVCNIDAPDARDVREYLEQRRLLAEARRDGWGALPGADAAHRAIVEHVCGVVGEETWAQGGLSGPDGTGLVFRHHRVLIPWRDADGVIVALQRRVLPPDSDDGPKYVFSRARSPRAPYGADGITAGTGALEVAYVEGAVDVLAMRALCAKRGLQRIVLGVPGVSNWRSARAEAAKGRVAHVAFDNDEAGDAAANRVAPELHRAGATRVVRTRPTDAKDWAAQLAERMLA